MNAQTWHGHVITKTMAVAGCAALVLAVTGPTAQAKGHDATRETLATGDGWGSDGTVTTGGAAADAAHVYTVTDWAGFKAALAATGGEGGLEAGPVGDGVDVGGVGGRASGGDGAVGAPAVAGGEGLAGGVMTLGLGRGSGDREDQGGTTRHGHRLCYDMPMPCLCVHCAALFQQRRRSGQAVADDGQVIQDSGISASSRRTSRGASTRCCSSSRATR